MATHSNILAHLAIKRKYYRLHGLEIFISRHSEGQNSKIKALATWGLSCIMQGLLSWYTGSVVEVLGLGCSTACGSNLVPWPGVESISPTLQGRFLTTGPLGKFPVSTFASALCLLWKRPTLPHPLDEKCVYRLLGWSGHGWNPQIQDQS